MDLAILQQGITILRHYGATKLNLMEGDYQLNRHVQIAVTHPLAKNDHDTMIQLGWQDVNNGMAWALEEE